MLTESERLFEIKEQIERLHRSVLALIDAQAKVQPDELPWPRQSEHAKTHIHCIWGKLRSMPEFTVNDVMNELVTKKKCSQPAYSTVLSGWAKDGYLEMVKESSGRRAARYRVKVHKQAAHPLSVQYRQ